MSCWIRVFQQDSSLHEIETSYWPKEEDEALNKKELDPLFYDEVLNEKGVIAFSCELFKRLSIFWFIFIWFVMKELGLIFQDDEVLNENPLSLFFFFFGLSVKRLIAFFYALSKY